MSVDTWAELIAMYYQLAPDLIFTGSDLVEAIHRSKWLDPLLDSERTIKEDLCLYRNKHRPKGGKQIYCFLATGKNEKPIGNNASKEWFKEITNKLLNLRVTRSSTINLETPIETTVVTGKRKRPQIQESIDPHSNVSHTLKIDPCDHSSCSKLSSSLAISPLPQLSSTESPPIPSSNSGIYWLSPEAKKLFAPKSNESVLEGIDAQIRILKKANETHLSYLDIIDNPQQDTLDEDSLTTYQVWALQQRCLVLCLALKLAKEKMNGIRWEQCCAEAIDYASGMCMTLTSRPQTVMEWYRLFRRNRKFLRPPRKKDNLPPFLQQNPNVVQAMQQYRCENLSQLSIEFMTEYVHDVVLPAMVAEEKNVSVQEVQRNPQEFQNEMQQVFKEYGLICVCPSTVYKWMKCLGFKYETRKKRILC